MRDGDRGLTRKEKAAGFTCAVRRMGRKFFVTAAGSRLTLSGCVSFPRLP